MTKSNVISSHSVFNAGEFLYLKIFYNNLYHRISDQKTSREAILSTLHPDVTEQRKRTARNTSLLLEVSRKEEKRLDKFRTCKCVGLLTDENEQNEITLVIQVILCGIKYLDRTSCHQLL